ncbi:MAG: energy transducer TonB [Sulfuritalea sp.]|nr:energy transducer TonB [Sulfuritalea sp.]
MLEATLVGQAVSLPESDAAPFSSASVERPARGDSEAASGDPVSDVPRDDSGAATGSGWLPLPAMPKRVPVYFTARELHRRPSPIGTVLQEEAGRIYPDSTTRLRLLISEQGQVDHAEILSTTDPRFAGEALRAFARARYIPGALAGRRVKSELRLEVTASNAIGMAIRQED